MRESILDLVSPDGDLHLEVAIAERGGLEYRVFRGSGSAKDAVRWSALAVVFEKARFDTRVSVDDTTDVSSQTFAFDLPHGKRRRTSADANMMSVVLSNPDATQIALDLVAFDDGVAHRFRVLDANAGMLIAETSSFVFDTEGEKHVQIYDEAALHCPASESLFGGALPIGAEFPATRGWSFPALFHTDDNWTLLTESGVQHLNQASHLDNGIHPGEYVLTPPCPEEGEGPHPLVAAPDGWTLPWKVIITSTDIGKVMASDLAALLAPQSTMADTSWIRPGRVSWSWWSDSDSPTNPETLRHFIDFGAEMGWEYSLIDANWNTMPEGTIESLVAYAAEQEVGLFLWYNSGGPHNVVTEHPRDRMHLRDRRREEMAWLRDSGIVGIKVDFFHSDKQSMNAMALELLEDAADFGLLINFHGITAPKGWHRTWPHLMTTEAVRGAEQYKFDRRFPATAARHHTVLPFTRNAVAPMDYTPITLSDVDFPHLTTSAHELALGVLFESSLQHPADKPEAYRDLPQPAIEYLRQLPTVWDELVLLDGEPGSHVVLARRHDDRWWIAGINGHNHPLSLTVDFSGLTDLRGPLQIGIDGEAPKLLGFNEWTSGPLTVSMLPYGGFFAF